MSVFAIFAATYMCLVSIATIFGNGMVIAAWIFHRDIRNPRNLYLVSLATVDFITGLFQMPLLIGYEISETWPFGQTLCFVYIFNAWVLGCVSILHLIAIAIDTYQVTYDGVSYIQRRTNRSVLVRVGLIWIFGMWQMAPTLFDMDQISTILAKRSKCASIPSQAKRFHLCFGAYYFPVIIICAVYYDVYKEIRRRIRNKAKVPEDGSSVTSDLNLTPASSMSSNSGDRCSMLSRSDARDAKMKNVAEKEQRAAKTVGIIIGAFVLSWAPFFIMYPLIGLLPDGVKPPLEIFVLVLAVGFSNSAMNPIIYTFYNNEFRSAFRKMLGFKCGR